MILQAGRIANGYALSSSVRRGCRPSVLQVCDEPEMNARQRRQKPIRIAIGPSCAG